MSRKDLERAWKAVRKNHVRVGLSPEDLDAYEEGFPENLDLLLAELENGSLVPSGDNSVRQHLFQELIRRLIAPLFLRQWEGADIVGTRATRVPISQPLSIDIESLLSRVPDEMVIRLVRLELKDTRLLEWISAYLKVGLLTKNVHLQLPDGPQGGLLAPLLSNIVLYYLMASMEKQGFRCARKSPEVLTIQQWGAPPAVVEKDEFQLEALPKVNFGQIQKGAPLPKLPGKGVRLVLDALEDVFDVDS